MSEFELGSDFVNRTTPPQPNPEPEIRYVDRIIEKRQSTTGYWVAIIVLAILLTISSVLFVISCMAYAEQDDIINEQEQQIAELNEELISVTLDNEELQRTVASQMVRLGSSAPMIINDIELGNIDATNELITDFGEPLSTKSARYLQPRVYYFGMTEGSHQLKTKWIRPDGTVITGEDSPAGFSQALECDIYKGAGQTLNMSSWGWAEPGYWTPGEYRLEIWSGNTCLKTKSFTID